VAVAAPARFLAQLYLKCLVALCIRARLLHHLLQGVPLEAAPERKVLRVAR
jgi:hypothetical protein